MVTNLANVRYLSGFTGSAGVVVVTEKGALLTTDGRYRTQSAEQVEAAGLGARLEIAVGNGEGQREAVRAAVVAAGAGRVGLEADDVSWAASRRWRELLEGAADGVPVTGTVEALREKKDAGELDRMARAAAIADGALAEVLPMVADAATAPVSEADFAHRARHRDAPGRGRGPRLRHDRGGRGRTRPSRTTGRRPRRSPRAIRWSSTSAPSSRDTAPT